jgi:hypothetical protein
MGNHIPESSISNWSKNSRAKSEDKDGGNCRSVLVARNANCISFFDLDLQNNTKNIYNNNTTYIYIALLSSYRFFLNSVKYLYS